MIDNDNITIIYSYSQIMICVLHQVLLVDRVEAPVGWGLLLHGEGGIGRGYLMVTVGNIMVTILCHSRPSYSVSI